MGSYEGRRTRGRPRTRWADALKHIAGPHKHNNIKNAVKSVRMKLKVQKSNKYSGSVKLMH